MKTVKTRRARVKTLTEPTEVQAASLSIMEGSGERGAKPRPFSQEAAIAHCRSWVYAAAMINAHAVASVPLRLYVKKRGGAKCLFRTKAVSRQRRMYLAGEAKHQPHSDIIRKMQEFGDYEEIAEEHPLLTLLSTVNPYLNGFDMSTLRILWGELTGNAYMAMVHDDGPGNPPTQLWPLPPQWTWIIPDRERWIRGYVYGKSSERRIMLEPDEVIHFRRPNPRDLYYGMGKVEAAWGAVSINDSEHDKDLALMDNHARPDYAVLIEGGTQDQATKLQTQLEQRLKGKRKAGRPVVLGGGKITLMPLNFPPKDLVGRDNVVEEIAAVFGVPVSMLKANDPNLASAKAGYGQWREGTILPLCRMDEQQLNQSLVPLFSDDLVLAYDNPVPTDEAFALQRRNTSVASGILTANEGRVEEGYEPHEDPMADKLLVNGTPLGGAMPLLGFDLGAGAGSGMDDAEREEAKPAGEQAQTPAPAATTPVDGEVPPAGDAQVIQTTEAAVLNGAQITAAKDIVLAVVAGELPRDSGIGMLQTFFNLTPEKAEAIMGSAGKPDVATTPNPNPAAEAAQEAANAIANGDGGGGVPSGDDDGVETGDDGGDEPDQEEDADGGAKRARADSISMKAISNGCGSIGCTCHDDDTIEKAWDHYRTKAAADNTAREGEPENPLLTFARRMDGIFADQRKAVIGVLERGRKASPEVDAIIAALLEELNGFNDQIDGAVKPFVTRMAQVGGNVGLEAVRSRLPDFTGVFDVTNPEVQRFLEKYTVELRAAIQGYTGEAISKTVADGLANGASTADIARDLRTDASAAGGSLSPARSEAIARTESARAYVEGERKAWSDSGVVEGKEWLLAPDACDFCKEVARQFKGKRVAVDQPFFAKGQALTAGGATMKLDYSDVQGPPLHPNDRCDLVPVIQGV